MFNCLQTLDKLVDQQLNVSSASKVQITNENLEDCLTIAQVEAQNIKEKILQYILTCDNEQSLRHFISVSHSRLISLNNKLESQINLAKSRDTRVKLKSVQKAIVLVLEDLLTFIWKNYSNYCDHDQKVTNRSKYSFIKLARKEIQEICSAEACRKFKIIRVVLFPIKKLINPSIRL